MQHSPIALSGLKWLRRISPGLGAAFVAQLGLLVTGIIAARLLGVEDRGNLATLILVPLILSQLGAIGLPFAITYEVARAPDTAKPIAQSLWAPVAAQIVCVAILQAAVLKLALDQPQGELAHAAAISLLFAPSLLAYEYGMAFLQGMRRFTAFYLWRTAPALSYAASAGLLAATGEGTLVTLTLASTVCTLGCAGGAVWTASGSLPPAGRGHPSLRTMSKFGLKGLLGSSFPLETLRPDQIVVALVLPPAALGLYVSAVALTNLPRFVAAGIGMTAFPEVASASAKSSQAQALRQTRRWTMGATAVILAVVLPLGVVCGEVIRFAFGAEFAGATPIARVLLIAALLLGVRRVLADALRGAGKPQAGSIAEMASWIVFVPLVILLVSSHGEVGVAWALVAAAGAGTLALLPALRPKGGNGPRNA